MSVLINGFRIPTENDPKTFLLHFHDDGTAEMVALGYPQIRYDVVAVPTPHGRLIDADDLRAKYFCGEGVRHDLIHTTLDCVLYFIDNAETVIEASEEKT